MRLEVENLHMELRQRTLLEDISLRIDRGELFGVIGPNGAGKSCLLKAVAQLLPSQGNLKLDGIDARRLTPRQRATRLAYLGQGDEVVWPLSVRDFVSLGRIPYQTGFLHRRDSKDAAAQDQIVTAVIQVTRLEALQNRSMSELSGGERARARLARALAVQAPLLLADEPVASLDPFHQLKVMEMLRHQSELGGTVVVVLHDLTLASRFCHRVLLLHRGRAVACDKPRAVLTPKHLQQVYQVQAMVGEHQRQPYVLPWACQAENFSESSPSESTPSDTTPSESSPSGSILSGSQKQSGLKTTETI